jgi:hypothetical protein
MKREASKTILGVVSSVVFLGLAIAIDHETHAQTVTQSATGLQV